MRADQSAHFAHAFGALFIGDGRLTEFLAQVGFHHLQNQHIDVAKDGRDLLLHPTVVGIDSQRIALAADTAHSAQDRLLFDGMRNAKPLRNHTAGGIFQAWRVHHCPV